MRNKKSLGQHWLKDNNVVEKIMEAVGKSPDASIVEIGPGLGMLTKEIVLLKPKKFIAIEKDVRCRQTLEQIKNDNSSCIFDYIIGDVMSINFGSSDFLADKIISNLPYNISGPLIVKILEETRERDVMIVLMLQKEVAQRIVANPKDKKYGFLSVLTKMACQKRELLFDVEPNAFRPKPKVMSSVIRLYTKKNRNPLEKRAAEIAKKCFSHRRKQIINSPSLSSQETYVMEQLGIELTQRPELLDSDDFIRIAELLVNIQE